MLTTVPLYFYGSMCSYQGGCAYCGKVLAVAVVFWPWSVSRGRLGLSGRPAVRFRLFTISRLLLLRKQIQRSTSTAEKNASKSSVKGTRKHYNHYVVYFNIIKAVYSYSAGPAPRSSLPTGLRWMTELLDMTVWSPSIMSSSLLSSPASVRLLTELLWELALIDILGIDWLLPTLLTVPVLPLCSGSWGQRHNNSKTQVSEILFESQCVNYSRLWAEDKQEQLNVERTRPPHQASLNLIIWVHLEKLLFNYFLV